MRRFVSVLLVLALIFPTTLASAALPPTINFKISGFDGASISVYNELDERIMYADDGIPKSRYIEPGTNLRIAWQVSEDMEHMVLINDIVYTGSETETALITPNSGEVYEFDLINHAEVDAIIEINEPNLTIASGSPPQCSLGEVPEQLSGRINLDTRIIAVDYKITRGGEMVAQKTLPATEQWQIDTPNFIDGDNLLQITVLTVNGKQHKRLINFSISDSALDEADDDSDNLPNWTEDMLGTDKDRSDTDGDGLKDGFEFSFLTTDLLVIDTDANGVSDAQEDFDEDGLTNIQEQDLGTRPDRADTDGDGLSDGDEVNIYMTNPMAVDTDGDGLTDAEELTLGLNPNNPASDGHTPDSERTFEQSASDAVKDDSLLNSDNWLVPSISGTVPRDLSKNVLLERSGNTAFDGNRAVLSDVIDVSTSYTIDLTLSFKYKQAYTGDNKNLTIASFGEDGLVMIDTILDEANKTVSGNISGNGTYFVIDLDEFLKGLGIDVLSNISNVSGTRSALVQEDEIDFIYDNDGNVIEEINRVQAKSEQSSIDFMPYGIETFATETNATGKADVIFVIDTTGSMGSPIANVKNNINIFAEKLVKDYNVDANFSLIEYRDITVDGIHSTKQHKNLSSNWFTNVTTFKNKINTLAVTGGGDAPETPIDGLEMARRLDWRGDSTKFVVLITDAGYKVNNSYGISGMEQMAQWFADDNIIVSAIAANSNTYSALTNATDGLYGYINGNFSTVLLGLAQKIGDVTNAGGDWVFLDDFQAVKLSDTLENASTNDTDNDGLADARELGTSVDRNMMMYIGLLANKHSVPVENYTGKTSITVWKYSSNPVLLDTDYDGISDGNKDYDGETVTRDSAPRNNTFTGKLRWDVDDKPKESKQDIKFMVDYSLLFKSNSDYNKNLSVLTSLYAADIYDKSYLTVTTGASGGSDNPTTLGKLFGLKDVEDIKINGSDYGVDTDDCSEFVIGHRSVTYKGATKEIIVVIVRGTNGTNAEWSSNFDVGADTDEYYAAVGASHPDWKNKGNHKGFDVVSNRILTKINDYLSRHSLTSGSRAMLITGHSRGGAIANLLGAHYERNANIASYTYTFAAPNPTTDENHKNYKTIFNIRNTDDVITYLPIASWGFQKYGVTKEVSVETQYENKWGGRQEGTWEWLTGDDYNNDGGTQRTLEAFRKIATTRNDIYVLDSSSDGKVWENNVGHTTLVGAEKELASLTNSLRNEKLLKYCSLSIVGGGITPYHVEVNYSPAYLMQMLSNMTTKKNDDVGTPTLGRDVKGKYATAKASFVGSSGSIPFLGKIGGMAHPHLPVTYYLIAYNDFVNKV